MRRIALRLVVALLTFIVGVTISSLLTFRREVRFEKRVVSAPVLVAAPRVEEETLTTRACEHAKTIVSGGILNGKAVSKPAPDYPPIAKAARAQGTVVVQIVVSEDGDVFG